MPHKLPPIIGPKPLPVGQRPTCMYCGNELRPNFNPIYLRVTLPAQAGLYQVQIGRYFEGVYSYRSAFCGGTHAQYWAERQPCVIRRSGEYPALKQPEIKPSWQEAAERHISDGGHTWDFQLPEGLLKGAK